MRVRRSITVIPRVNSPAVSITTWRRHAFEQRRMRDGEHGERVVDRRRPRSSRDRGGRDRCRRRTRTDRRAPRRACPAAPRTRSMRGGVAWNWWVTSRPAITSGAAGGEHDRRRLRVGPDVELGRRRPVAERAAAHRARCRRSGRRCRVPSAARARCWSVGRPARARSLRSSRQVSTMNRTASVPSSGVVGAGRSAPSSPLSPCTNAPNLGSAIERPVASRVDGHVDAEQVAHHQRVVGRPFQRRVAGDRRDADQVGVAGRGDDGDGVVVARVAVEQDRGCRG